MSPALCSNLKVGGDLDSGILNVSLSGILAVLGRTGVGILLGLRLLHPRTYRCLPGLLIQPAVVHAEPAPSLPFKDQLQPSEMPAALGIVDPVKALAHSTSYIMLRQSLATVVETVPAVSWYLMAGHAVPIPYLVAMHIKHLVSQATASLVGLRRTRQFWWAHRPFLEA